MYCVPVTSTKYLQLASRYSQSHVHEKAFSNNKQISTFFYGSLSTLDNSFPGLSTYFRHFSQARITSLDIPYLSLFSSFWWFLRSSISKVSLCTPFPAACTIQRWPDCIQYRGRYSFFHANFRHRLFSNKRRHHGSNPFHSCYTGKHQLSLGLHCSSGCICNWDTGFMVYAAWDKYDFSSTMEIMGRVELRSSSSFINILFILVSIPVWHTIENNYSVLTIFLESIEPSMFKKRYVSWFHDFGASRKNGSAVLPIKIPVRQVCGASFPSTNQLIPHWTLGQRGIHPFSAPHSGCFIKVYWTLTYSIQRWTHMLTTTPAVLRGL